jgi:hypothetical protein
MRFINIHPKTRPPVRRKNRLETLGGETMFGPESNLLEHLAVVAWWILMLLMLFVLVYGIAFLGVRTDNEPAAKKAEAAPAEPLPKPPLRKARLKKRRS